MTSANFPRFGHFDKEYQIFHLLLIFHSEPCLTESVKYMNAKHTNYQTLELISSSDIKSTPVPSLWTRIKYCFMRLRTPSPQAAIPFIWKTIDASGKTRWNIFDRLTGQTLCFLTDEKFFSWLEQRYYR